MEGYDWQDILTLLGLTAFGYGMLFCLIKYGGRE